MRVALDEQIFAIQPYGGISRMFAELALQFTRGVVPGLEIEPLHAPIVNRYVLDNPELRTSLEAREATNQWTALARYFSRVKARPNCDVIHNTFYLPHGLASGSSAKRVVTVHDMIPELMPHTRRRLDWLTFKKRYVETADQIICVSNATKQDLIKVYGIPNAPISVVHHGVDPRFHPNVARMDFLPQRYVLFVGHRDQYKDADVLFQAFAEVSKHDPDLHLLCVGGAGLTEAEIDRLRALGIRERVAQRFLPDDQMAAAYAHALMFVFPSHFEGFGLPALEAMACGTATVLANSTSLPEVGGDAALYFEPGDVHQLASVMRVLIADENARKEFERRGESRAAQFTWSNAAMKTAEVYFGA